MGTQTAETIVLRDRNRTRGVARGLLLASIAATLAACGGGDSDSVNLGSGQGPDPATVDFPMAYVKRSLPLPPMEFEDDDRLEEEKLEEFKRFLDEVDPEDFQG